MTDTTDIDAIDPTPEELAPTLTLLEQYLSADLSRADITGAGIVPLTDPSKGGRWADHVAIYKSDARGADLIAVRTKTDLGLPPTGSEVSEILNLKYPQGWALSNIKDRNSLALKVRDCEANMNADNQEQLAKLLSSSMKRLERLGVNRAVLNTMQANLDEL